MAKFISHHFKVLLRKLHNAEHFDFFDNGIIKGLETLSANIVIVSGLYDALKTVFLKEDALYKLSQASALTSEITGLHNKRISLFVFFWNYVAIFKYLEDAAKALIAEKLLFLRNTYKDLPSASYQDASGMLTNFLQDCNSNAWKSLIDTLGLTFIVTIMEATNTSFKGMYLERSVDKEHVAEMGNLAETRLDVDNAFEGLIDAINVAWAANEIGAKDPAVRTKLLQVREVILATIRQAELNIAHRGRHKKDDDKTDEGTQTPGVTPPPAPPTTPQNPDTSLPEAPDTPPQNPIAIPPEINPDDLNPPSAGE